MMMKKKIRYGIGVLFLFPTIFLFFSCTPRVKQVVYKRSTVEVVVIQTGKFYPVLLDDEDLALINLKSEEFQISVPKRKEVQFSLSRYYKNKTKLEKIFSKMRKYENIIVKILKKYNLPSDLKLLPVIESAYNPSAVSKAGASGLWQFMKQTASRYSLRINSYVDERFDIIKSTEAAARYLKDLYKKFKRWDLVLAAYHCGEGCVERKAKESFWDSKQKFPSETRKYVPSFFAVLLLYNNLDKYGLKLEKSYEKIKYKYIETDTYVKDILPELGLSFDEFKRLNPHIKGEIIPAGSYVYYK